MTRSLQRPVLPSLPPQVQLVTAVIATPLFKNTQLSPPSTKFPLSSETPSTAQTPHSPPIIQTPHSPLPLPQSLSAAA
ncbi:hypothetical protein ACSQ67_026108 [Phaseolus vulgaris]